MNKNLIIAIAIVVIALGIFFLWKYYRAAPISVPSPTSAEKSTGLGSEISKQVQNPTDKLPETNPFQAKVNPFGDVKTNPYKNVYKNPFQ